MRLRLFCWALAAWHGDADMCVGPTSQLKERMHIKGCTDHCPPPRPIGPCLLILWARRIPNCTTPTLSLRGVSKLIAGKGAWFVGSCAALCHLHQIVLCSTPCCKLPCLLHELLRCTQISRPGTASHLSDVLCGRHLRSVALLTLLPCACLLTRSLCAGQLTCHPCPPAPAHSQPACPALQAPGNTPILCLSAAAQEQEVPPY